MEKTIYFKGLNGIRAIAALLVVVDHTDLYAYLFNLKSTGFHLNGMGGHAVNMFFVLSGFLITYLLLAEKEKTNSINFKSFYLRRILRIWPVYYLSLLISLILIYFDIIPNISDLFNSVILYIFLLANVAYVLNLAIPIIAPLWSVGVEEQFYLIWPHIIKRTSKYLKVFIFLFLLFFLIKLLVYLIFSPESILYKFLWGTRLNIMCMGAIGAYLVFSKNKVLKLFFRKEVQIISWGILIISIIYKPIHIFSFIDNELNSLIYLVIILNVSSNTTSLISLENKFMNFIGKISYGIYVYHTFIIFLASSILVSHEYQLNRYIIHLVVIAFTVLVSWFSYSYFESPFLKIKNKYSIIKSTNTKQKNV
jgi:peptidoglycan/LPS O-acetylase OafA/YrhL